MTIFKTIDVLSCSTGRLIGNIGGVYKVLNYLTASDVYTHQIPQLMAPASAVLKQIIPDLPTKKDTAGLTGENVKAFRDRWLLQIGETVDLPEILAGCIANGDPLVDLLQLARLKWDGHD